MNGWMEDQITLEYIDWMDFFKEEIISLINKIGEVKTPSTCRGVRSPN